MTCNDTHSARQGTSANPALRQPMRVGRQLRNARKQGEKVLRRIERAHAEGDTHRVQSLQRLYLSSYYARLEAVARANRKRRARGRVNVRHLPEIARQLDAWKGVDEPAIANARDKPGFGNFRTVLSFGLMNRALQRLVRKAVIPVLDVDARQHAMRNGGRGEACRRVHRALHDRYEWFIGLDIKEFYPSIQTGRLPNLIPMPRQVTTEATSPPTNITVGRIGKAITSINLMEDARRGVSQGSSVSPIIAEAVVSRLMQTIDRDCLVINFADDFGVMARTKREALAIAKALTNASKRSPFGPFELKRKTPLRHVCDGFDFLGYHFKRVGFEPTCRPSERNEVAFFTGALAIIRRIQRHRPRAKEHLQGYVRSWAAAFPLWRCGADLFWPRYWAVGVAREHAPHALADVEHAMAWDGNGFGSVAVPPSCFVT